MPTSFMWRTPDWEAFDLFDPGGDDLWAHVDGIYILAAEDKRLRYPGGRSPVFYIGKAGRDGGRLYEHHQAALRANLEFAEDGELSWEWHDRYRFAVRYGAALYWYSTRGTQTAASLEYDAILRFFEIFRTMPRCNHQRPSG